MSRSAKRILDRILPSRPILSTYASHAVHSWALGAGHPFAHRGASSDQPGRKSEVGLHDLPSSGFGELDLELPRIARAALSADPAERFQRFQDLGQRRARGVAENAPQGALQHGPVALTHSVEGMQDVHARRRQGNLLEVASRDAKGRVECALQSEEDRVHVPGHGSECANNARRPGRPPLRAGSIARIRAIGSENEGRSAPARVSDPCPQGIALFPRGVSRPSGACPWTVALPRCAPNEGHPKGPHIAVLSNVCTGPRHRSSSRFDSA